MKRFLSLLFLQAFLPVCALADQSGWTSGGGLLFRDKLNPWWVQNTAEVRYCISIREERFRLPRETIEQAITDGFAYWKKELAKARDATIPDLEAPNNKIRVGTQRFVQVGCDGPVDLTFQLGYLTKEQQQSFEDPTDIVAAAVRTAYDPQELKGKGYIYVAAAQDIAHSKKKGTEHDPWLLGDGILFRATVLHEMGHIFGVIHSSSTWLMGETLVEELVRIDPAFAEFLARQTRESGWPDVVAPTQFRAFPSCVETVKRTAGARHPELKEKAFGIPSEPGKSCTAYRYEDGVFEIQAGPSPESMHTTGRAPMQVVGTVTEENLVSFWLPPEHNSFFKKKSGVPHFVKYPLVERLSYDLQGEFELFASKGKTPITFKISPDTHWPPRVTALIDGQLVTDALGSH